MKQTYTRPTVSSIELVTDQAVLSNCKSIGIGQAGPAPNGNDCEPGGIVQCLIAGS